MIGCRPFTEQEIRDVSAAFSGYMEHRNRLLFWLGITTGFRISELLSLQIGDVWRNDRIPEHIRISRRNTKGRRQGQSAHIAPITRPLIRRWLFVARERYGPELNTPLFPSRSRKRHRISRMQAHRFLTETMEAAGLYGADGELATHCMRKTYAATMWEHFGDIFSVQKALRHKSPASTVAYLSFDESDLVHAVDLKWPDKTARTSKPLPQNVIAINERT